MYRAVSTILGDAASPEMTVRENDANLGGFGRHHPAPGATTERKKKFPSRRPQHRRDGNDATTSPAHHPPRTQRAAGAGRPARWPNTPRHEAAAAGRRPAKERGGRRQKAGAAWSTARTRCWPGHHPPPAVRHQAIITTTAAQRPPGRLRTRISPPPFEDFGESS